MFNEKRCSMEPNFKFSRLSQSLGLLFVLGASTVFAQVTQPNAGSLLNAPLAPPAVQPKFPSIEMQQQPRPALVTPGGVKVKVVSFKFSGNTVIDSDKLAELLAGKVGQELDLAGLDEAAGIISQYYRSLGYFVARAYLPAQEVASGNLEIAVIEGRLGGIKFTRNGVVRLSDERAEAMMRNAAPLRAPVNEQKIERGLMLLNDLPGVDVKSTLVPGATPGTTDLVIETTEGDVASGSADADNYGNKFTGAARVGATLNASDLSGYGDQATLRAMTSGTGMTYARASYTLPVGDLGTKAGLAYSKMNYKLGGDFASLNGKGDSGVLSLFAVHPLLRSRNENAYITGSFDNKNLNDSQNGINVTDKSASVFALGLSGDQRDAFGGGGLNAGSMTLTGGTLNVGGNANYAANDAITAHSNGHYAKLGFNFSRLQRIDDSWSWYASLSGQHASKNLDSSEKFSLGGTGVRAYPQGEASGDSGTLLNLEARYSVPTTDWGNLQLVAFLDTGSITLHQNTWTGWQPSGRPNFPNTYSLSGAGLGLNLYRDADFSVRSAVAVKLGSNAGADVLGRDADGSSRNVRFWLQASKQI